METKDAVLAHMRTHPEPVTIRSVAKAIGRNFESVWRAMWRLHIMGRQVHRVFKGHESPTPRKLAQFWSLSPHAPASRKLVRKRGVLICASRASTRVRAHAPSGVLWASLDWTRTDTDLATVAGCSRQLVARARRRLGAARPNLPKERDPAFWAAVDWSKTSTVIANEVNVSPRVVRDWRRRLGRPFPDRTPAPPAPGMTWSEVDWTRSNRALRLAYSVSKQTIAARRATYAPEPLRVRASGRPRSVPDTHE